MVQSKVLFVWEFSFSGTPDFWNGINGYDYTIRYVDQFGKVVEANFKEIINLICYVKNNNIEFGKYKTEIIPPCGIALVNYIYQYFDNEVLLRYRRPVSRLWKSQYDAIDRGKKNYIA